MSLSRAVPALALVVLIGCGSSSTGHSEIAPKRHKAPARRAAHRAPIIPPGPGALAVMAPRAGLTLRDRPRGRVVARLRSRTEWGSPTVVWAVQRRGHWLGVIASALSNDEVAWLDARRGHPRIWREQLSLEASLSKRELVLRRAGRVVRRMTVAIGQPDTPTPTGRFSVTDKLIPDRSEPYYGCCILALSGHQPHLRPGWAGGDRIAIHGGPTVGAATSAGCLHARNSDLRRLMRLLPLGTPVVIRS